MKFISPGVCTLIGGAIIFCCDVARGGQLSGSFSNLTAGMQINLTTGTADWMHWGLVGSLDVNRKAGVGPQITDLQILQGEELSYVSYFKYTNNLGGYTWTDGTPTLAVTNTTNGVWMYAYQQQQGTGFKLSVPADTRSRTLRLYVGVDSGDGTLVATLSDGSAAAYSNTLADNTANNRVYFLNYAANSAGQRLDVQWTMTKTQGNNPYPNVHLQAVALVTSNISVLPAVSIVSPTNGQSLVAAASIPVSISASDLDGVVTNVAFYVDGVLQANITNSPWLFSWAGATPGFHRLTAVARDNAGEQSTSSPIEAYVYAGTDLLAGNDLTLFPEGTGLTNVDLSAEGTLDWTHWGLTAPGDFDRKSGALPLIGNFTYTGTNALQAIADSYVAWSWSGGSPTTDNFYSTSGLQVRAVTNGFEFQLATSPQGRRARVYLGDYANRATVLAYLTNHTAPLVFQKHTLTNVYTLSDGFLELRYASAVSNSLVVRYEGDHLYDVISGGLRLHSATVQPDDSLFLPLVISNQQAMEEGHAFSFLTQPNHSYTVESTPVLPATLWTTVTNFPGPGGWVTITNSPLPEGQAYYRVRAE